MRSKGDASSRPAPLAATSTARLRARLPPDTSPCAIELSDLLRGVVDFVVGERRVHREHERAREDRLGPGQSLPDAERRKLVHALAAPLQQGRDTMLGQAGPQLVAPLRFDLVILEDVYVRISWRDIGWRRQHHLAHAAQVARVATGQLASSCDFIGDIPQLYTQHRRLEGVEPAVTTPPDHF